LIFKLTDAAILRAAIDERMQGLADGFSVEEWLSDEANVALTDGYNIMLLERAGPVFTAHWVFADGGRRALSVGREMLAFAFDHLGAQVIKGLTPAHCRAAKWFNRQMGGKSYGTIETARGPMELFIKVKSWGS
jgi:hypothetical protein